MTPPPATSVKLTALSTCAGCAAKLSQPALADLLRRLPLANDPRLLVGSATADDAAVFRLDARRALVQTVDFFPPIVDDPFPYGQIAAANALSDVYAMGGRPLTALNLLAVPDDLLPPGVIRDILRGGAAKAREAGCAIVGGHTLTNPQPLYGLSVTGLVDPRRILTNAGGQPGDRLVLTKPLGTGIVTTGIKRNLATPAVVRRAVASMRHLNRVGADLAERGWIRAATDITGFGVLGHLGSLCRASGVGARISLGALPALPGVADLLAHDCVPGGTRRNLEHASAWTEFDPAVPPPARWLAADAQTSGGLLLCVPPKRLSAVLRLLRQRRTPSHAVIGVLLASPAGRIQVTP